MTAAKKVIPCEDAPCRVLMLEEMYAAIEGTSLLLEAIQPEFDINFTEPSPERIETAFQTLIATLLSVRTRDETTLKVIELLWDHYSTPKSMASAPLEHLEELIHSSGTYKQKALRIKETARIIHEDYNDVVPDTEKELLSLPGVGRKVANCVLVVSFGKPAIPVDTHVHRISNRIGWCITKTPEKTEKALVDLFPISAWKFINYTLVSYGKNICKPQRPLCDDCVVADRCLKRILPPQSKRPSKRTKKK